MKARWISLSQILLVLLLAPLQAEEPKDLTALRASFEKARAAALSPLEKKYEDALLSLKERLTKSGDLDGALAVHAELEALRPPVASAPEDDKKPRLSKFKSVEEFSAWLHTTEWKNEAGTRYRFPEPNVLETNKNGTISLYPIKIPEIGVVTWVFPSTGATNTMQVASDLRTATCDNAPALERIVSE